MARYQPRIKLLCVGKTERGFIQEGLDYYSGRLKPFAVLEMLEIRTGGHSGRNRTSALEHEGNAILKALQPGEFMMLLDETGHQYTTREFAQWLQKHQEASGAQLTFVIGGAYGVSSSVKNRANSALSISKMTMPHQLVRVVFLEQLYRALTLNAGHGYHHD